MSIKIKIIDIFAGAGGFSLAAHELGAEILAAIENDRDACDTYQNNIINRLGQKTKLYEQDILKLSPAFLMSEINILPRELDLLVGGPPCQGFSSHRINDAGIDDPRNKLLIRYFDFIHEIQPKLFLVENVPGMLWPRHKKYLDNFLKLARENGYLVKNPAILNAKSYGVPQNRNRVFIVGIRADLEKDLYEWPLKEKFFDPKKQEPKWITASKVFEKPPEEVLRKLEKRLTLELGHDSAQNIVGSLIYGEPIKSIEEDPCAITMQHSIEMIERLSNTPINGSRDESDFCLPCHEGNYGGHKDVYGRIRLHLPGPTMTTGCFNPSKGRFTHPWENHGISPRHAARFQTFPDDYIFSGGITSQGKQIGNAVPVDLGKALIHHIAQLLVD